MGSAALVTEGLERPAIRVSGFRKIYCKRVAVEGVNLTVPQGSLYGLLGPDGAGKSTLMKAIAGVLHFDAGELEVLGSRIDSEEAAEVIKAGIGFMPQGLGLNLYPDLSIEENIDFFARLRLLPEKDLRKRKERLLSITRLEKFRNRPMKQLSGGMKQKLGLICTLIHAPALIILDEPTTGVDPVSRRDFWSILSQLQQEHSITVLASTAYMDEAGRFQHIALMFDGHILAEGEPDSLQSQVTATRVQVRAEPQAEALRLLKSQFTQVDSLGQWLHVLVEEPNPRKAAASVEQVLSPVHIHEIQIGAPDLEDVFMATLRKQQPSRQESPSAQLQPLPVEISPRGEAPAIAARELTRDFGNFRAVNHVSFCVSQGSIFGLLGANGAGKTTVIKMLTGILTPSGGEGHVAGVDMRRAGKAIKRRIGYASQTFSLYQDLSVMENIMLFAGIYGLSRADARERAQWILDTGGLRGHEADKAGSLPMGVRQRLALGCALVHRPRLLFLDEPTSGVDPVGRRRLWEILFELSRKEGVTVLVTTHYMSEAERCDHLALMHGGRIVADGTPDDLKRDVENEMGRLLEIETDRPAQALARLRACGYPDASLFGKKVHLLSRQLEGDGRRISEILSADGIEAKSIAPRALSMEDVFVYRITDLERRERTAGENLGTTKSTKDTKKN